MTDLETNASVQGAPGADVDADSADTTAAGGSEPNYEWVTVGEVSAVTPDRGVAVLVGGTAIAVFRLSPVDGEPEEWCAVSHIDPFSGAPIMARGLVGSVGTGPSGFPTVASPLHKQRFNLRTGRCLDNDDLCLSVYQIRIRDGLIQVSDSVSKSVSKLRKDS